VVGGFEDLYLMIAILNRVPRSHGALLLFTGSAKDRRSAWRFALSRVVSELLPKVLAVFGVSLATLCSCWSGWVLSCLSQ